MLTKVFTEGNRVYIPCVYALNKIDAISIEELGRPVELDPITG